jgi:hypothetical protein
MRIEIGVTGKKAVEGQTLGGLIRLRRAGLDAHPAGSAPSVSIIIRCQDIVPGQPRFNL